jgi:MFS family permease
LILFSFSRTLWLASLLLVMAGAGMMIQLTSTNTFLQSVVPDGLRGRLMSFYAMTLMGLAPIGSLLAGVLAQEIGAPGTVALGGVLCLLGASWFTAYLPRLAMAGRTPVLDRKHGPDGGVA